MRGCNTRLVLLCPAWKKWGTATAVKPNTTVLHSRADDVVPFADTKELLANSGLPQKTLIEVGSDHRLADPDPLGNMLEVVEKSVTGRPPALYGQCERTVGFEMLPMWVKSCLVFSNTISLKTVPQF